jgi:hypothetical protein
MRQFLPLTTIVFLFTSCTTYQYMTVHGKNIAANDRREFIMENDSIRVKYNFSGADAPINVEVQNKLDKPVYIDWNRSALIINDKAISYVPSSVHISGSVNATTTSWFRANAGYPSSTTDGHFSGSVGVPRDLDFIPPGSYKSKTPLGVTNVFYPEAREKAKRIPVTLNTGYSGTAMVKEYADSSSPFRFSSYLTLYVEGAPDKPVVFEHEFFVSEIWTTTLAPHNFRFINDKHGDRFYVRTTNAFGKVAGGFGILAGYALITYAEVKTEEANRRNNYKH